MDNMAEVIHQMQAFGVQFKDKDLPLTVGMAKRKTCGIKGKWWYWLQEFRARNGTYIVGKFGSYKTGDSAKVEIDWKPLGDAERARQRAEQLQAEQARQAARAAEAELAAMGAADLWRRAARTGTSPYLQRK